MSELWSWATRLALEVAPEEAELAPAWAAAYARGGRDRRDLLDAPHFLGAFGAESLTSTMPAVLSALALVAPLLVNLFSSRTVTETIGAVKNAFSLMEVREKNRGRSTPPTQLAGGTTGGANPDTAASHSEPLIPMRDVYAPLRQTVNALTQELQKAGLADERAEIISFRVLRVLLEEPKGASEFVTHLAAKPR
jgi:hypothetical protein